MRTPLILLAFLSFAAPDFVPLDPASPGRQQVFRAATDLIAVDVQVVDRQGLPILDLDTSQFEVTLNGRQRRVASVDLIRYDQRRSSPTSPGQVVAGASAGATEEGTPTAAGDRPRVFILAVDTWSFDVATSRGMMTAAKQFVERLQPTDLIGVFAYPFGPDADPTTDHASILRVLDKVQGAREQPPFNKYRLTASEIVDGGGAAAMRICRSSASNVDPTCIRSVEQEALALVRYYEMTATQSLGRLRDLIRGLARFDRRKTLVLLSGGMIVADRPGQRPDIGDLDSVVGHEAARANVAVYTLFVDWKFLDQFSASSPRASMSLLRETTLNSRWLDRFSGTAGGKLFTVSTGNGTFAFDRIVTETSAYYLLGVEPQASDRDGRPRALGVKVRRGGATVRARAWAIVPKAE